MTENPEVTKETDTIYEALPGTSIRAACKAMTAKAVITGHRVTMNFNGIRLFAEPGMPATALEDHYHQEYKREHEEWLASPEGQAAEREEKKRAKLVAKAASEGIVSFNVSDADRWTEWREANEGEGKGEACLRFAARWARLMDNELSKGAILEDIAESTSYRADTEGITGFMYGVTVSILAECWVHGEALRHWHNLDTQIGNEGEDANESGATLNPARIIFSYSWVAVLRLP